MAAGSDLRLVAFVLVVVGGVLALVNALRAPLFGRGPFVMDGLEFLLLLGGAVVVLAGAARARDGRTRDAGLLAVVGALLVLLGGLELAGVLALVGGLLYLAR